MGAMSGLGSRLLYRVDHRVWVSRPRHLVGLRIDAIVDVRTVSTQFLEQRDCLGRFLLREDRQFEGQQLPMSGQKFVSALGSENHDDQI